MPITFDFKPDPTAGLVPPGVHRFVVTSVEEKPGAEFPYLNLTLAVYVQGVKWNSKVFEVLSSSPSSKFRVDQFFAAVAAPTAGVATESWFLNKSGWAKFDNKVNQNGVLTSRVSQYLSKDQAEELVAKAASEWDGISGGTNGAAAPAVAQQSAQRSQSAAQTPAPSPTKKRKSAIAEMDADSSPF